MPTVDAIRAALTQVQDPDLHQDLVALNMIRNITIEGGAVAFDLVLTTGACPVKKQLEDECRAAARSVAGVTAVEIRVSAEVPKGPSRQDVLPGVRHVIGVGSGKGGVGKSTVTANLACALVKHGAHVGILDADIYGPSMPMMFGVNRQPFIHNKKMVPLMSHGVHLISMGFLVDDQQPVIWRGPMIMGALKQFLTDVDWGELDYLLVDLPPGTGDIQMTLIQTVPLAGCVVVSTPQAVALLDARRSVKMFQKMDVPIFGIVENMSQFICPQCQHVSDIFGAGGAEAEATACQVPFLGRVPIEPAVRAAGDDGRPVVLTHPDSHSARAFTSIAERVAQRASIHALRP